MRSDTSILLVLLLFLPTTPRAEQDPSIDCVTKLAGNQQFSQIEQKMALGTPPKPTFRMLADESFATEEDRKLIAEWANELTACHEIGESFRQRTYPQEVVSLLTEAVNVLLSLAVDVYQRKIPFGEFNKQRVALGDDLRNRVVRIVQQIKGEQARQRQAEQRAEQQARVAQETREAQEYAMRRQAIFQYMLGQMQNRVEPQPLVPYQMEIPRTTVTDCQRIGSLLHCITR